MPERGRASVSHDLIRYLPAKVVPASLGFLIIVLLSRRLAPGAYGSYAALLAIARLADSFCFAWLRQGILRFHPEVAAHGDVVEWRRLLSSLVVVIVGVEAIAVLGLSLCLQHGLTRALLAAGLVVSMTPYSLLTTVVQAERAAGAYARSAFVQSAVQLIWVGVFVFLAGRGEDWALLGVLASMLAGTAYLLYAAPEAVRSLPLPPSRLDRRKVKELFGYGFPVALAVLGFALVNQGNRLLLFALGSADAAGVYSSAYDLVNGSLSLLMTPFLLASHPAIMEARLLDGTRARETVEAILRGVTRHLAMVLLPVFFLSVVLREQVFDVLGPGYGVEGWVVPVLVAGAFLAQFAMYAHKGLEIADRTPAILKLTLACGALNLGLNALLIPRYTYFAVAIVAVVSHLAYVLLATALSRAYATLRIPWGSVRRFTAVLIGAGIVFYAARTALASAGAPRLPAALCASGLFAGVYAAVLVWMGELPSPATLRTTRVSRVAFGGGEVNP